MLNFDYQALPWNIVFGAGSLARLPGELAKLDCHRALVLVTPNQAEQGRAVVALLGRNAAGLFDGAMMHVPAQSVERAMREIERTDADCTIAIGGGSTTGLGKALALKGGIPNIAIPTTYAGSEMTNIWGITENERKVTGRDLQVLPRLTIYDPELTLGLPAHIAGPSGINALAQAAVNITAAQSNPMVSILALEAVRALAESLPRVIAQPDNLDARSTALYGAMLAGGALGTGVTSLHHRLCHTFGGTFNTPHAETHTILLPHCVAFNASAVPEETNKLARALGCSDAPLGIFELAKSLGAPTALKNIGVKESDLDRAAKIATDSPLVNPRPVSFEGVRALIENAYHGHPPASV